MFTSSMTRCRFLVFLRFEVYTERNQIRVLTAALAARDAECDSMSEAVLTLKDELAVIQAQGVPQAAKEVARRVSRKSS